MSYLHALLIAEARRAGRAQRSATMRHRHIIERPLGLVLWQLGAEPFTAAAVAWGFGPEDRKLVVPGEPRDRELAFRALTQVARDLNPWLEAAVGRSDEAPQIIVPNAGNLTLLGRLGRRLAYLQPDGPWPADPELIRLGVHLRFLHEHARRPGQQLVLVLTDLLGAHWASELSSLEAQSLPALDAAIEPPAGTTGHQAAFEAERLEIGPAPGDTDDDAVAPLIGKLNEVRARGTDEAVVAPLRAPIEAHYARLVDRSWALLWRCVERERRWAEAPSVARRWEEDVGSWAWHLDFAVAQGGRYRTADSHARAARVLRSWEEAQRLLDAEEAIDDPLRMVPSLLANDAIAGEVVEVDLTNQEVANVRPVTRPLVTLESRTPILVPIDSELYWTKTPRAAAYTLCEVREDRARRVFRAVLKHETARRWTTLWWARRSSSPGTTRRGAPR